MSTVLEINNLTFGYTKEKNIFEDFSLSLNVGEVCSIVGPSGVGKSTLFELISGELNIASGSITHEKEAQIYQDAYISFHHSYTIYNQIEDVASMQGHEEYAKRLELDTALLDKKPFELSGGQLQRCSILRALLMKPKLILADEPTSALDNLIQLGVMKLLMQFLDEVGILLITHDDDLASWCSDKIVRLS